VRLAQVVTNLLTNAAKFTPEGGLISVSLWNERGDAVLRVRDSGIGLTATQAADVFGMFTQIRSGDDAAASGGLGIGLWLVRQLVELHGGTVVVRSDGPGCGSEFELRIPTVGAASVGEPAPGYVEPLFPRGRKILVVDDNVDAADTLADLLRHAGNEIHTAHTGRAALEAYARHAPQWVLLDLGLPDIDGFEVCRRLRAAPGGADLKVIAVSGWGQAADRQRAHEAGFDLHLTKPVDLALLRTALLS
jgi:CheY-like chemotaxis protein